MTMVERVGEKGISYTDSEEEVASTIPECSSRGRSSDPIQGALEGVMENGKNSAGVSRQTWSGSDM